MKNKIKEKLRQLLLLWVLFFTIVISPAVLLGATSQSTSTETTTLDQTTVSSLKDQSGNNYLNDSDLSSLESSSSSFVPDLSSVFGVLLQKDIDSIEQSSEQNNTQMNVFVMFNNGTSRAEQDQIIQQLGWTNSIITQYTIIPAVLIRTTYNNLMEKSGDLSKYGCIYKVFKDEVTNINDFTSSATPSASTFNESNWWLQAIGAVNVGYNGSGVGIAILDTGISQIHEDLTSKTTETYNINFASENGHANSTDYIDENGHGTHCAGIAAGDGISSNGKYIGVAPEAKLYNVKVANASGSISASDVVSAVQWCINQPGINIISMSFGFDYAEVYNPETAALTVASNRGIVCLASAGNSGPEYYTGGDPASGLSVISVGAINSQMNVTDFSSVGPDFEGHVMPDVLAPGSNIISTEQYDSLLGNYVRYTNDFVTGQDPESDYIPLSGTSMACPMVAGSVALILQAFPGLSPEAVRIALEEGAYPPNKATTTNEIGNNGVGAGIINVTASINWLKSQPDRYNITSTLPKSLPISPFDLLKFPGDQQYTNVSVFYGGDGPATFNINLPTINGLKITTDKNQITFSNHSVSYINIGIQILDNSSIGLKNGTITLTDPSTSDIVATIQISLNVSYPIGTVYFDGFHGLNDIYPGWPTGYNQIEIYDAMKYLENLGYKLDYSMDNWTYNYNDSEAQLITPDKISKADIVVLQTPVLPYTNYEINTLKDYVDSGGSILVLGTRYQAIARNSINNLLSTLDTGISINANNIYNYTDLGLGISLSDYNVTNVTTSSPIFSSGDSFEYWFGPTLSVNSSSTTSAVAFLQNQSIVASYDGHSQGKGNVVVWSDYHWLRNDIFGVQSIKSQEENILSNLFKYLNTGSRNQLSVEAQFNTTQTTKPSVSVDISVVNRISSIPNATLNPGEDINATLIYPNSTSYNVNLTKLGNGIYSNNSITLGASSNLPYTLLVNVTGVNISGTSNLVQRTFKIFYINNSDQVILTNPSVSSPEIYGYSQSSETISYDGNSNDLNATLIGCTTPDSIYNTRSLVEYNFDLNQTTPTSKEYSTIIYDPGNVNNGYFVFYAIGNRSNYINFNASRSLFLILPQVPVIDNITSTFNGISFNSTMSGNSYYIQQVSTGTPISLVLKVSESGESASNLYAVAAYTAAASSSASGTIIPIYPENIPYLKLSYSASQNAFVGSFNVPTQLEFPSAGGPVEVSQQSPSSGTYYSLLWLTVRDSGGATSNFLFILYVNVVTSRSFTDYIPIVILFAVIIGVVIFLATRSGKRKKQPEDEYGLGNQGYNGYSKSYGSDFSGDMMYCINCGQKIRAGSKHCPYCGEKQYD